MGSVSFRGVPLRRRLFFLVVAALLPVVVMSAIAGHALFQRQRDQAERTALEITRALSTAIDAELRRSISALEMLAAAGTPVEDPESLRPVLDKAIRGRPNWLTLVVNGPDGRQVVNTRLPRGEPFPPVVDADSVREVIRSGRPLVSGLTRGPRVGWTVPVRVPMFHGDRVAYVLTTGVSLQSLLEVVLRQRLEEGWVVTAVDAKGSRVLRFPGQAEYIGTPVSGTLLKMMSSGAPEGTGITTTSEGHQVYTAFSRSPESGWTVALGIPRSKVEAAGWASLRTFGAGVALSILAGVLAALLIARSINRPIRELREAAHALGERRDASPVVTPIREIREVADTLVAASRQRAAAEVEREALLEREQAARAAAESANRAKDEFLAMLGHELRNPLGAASNAANLLQSPDVPEEARRKAGGIILRQVTHLARLTDDLLDAGRALLGKIVLRRQAVNVATAASQSIASLRAAGKLDRHEVVEQLEEAWTQVDPVRLDQVVTNLVVNAAKYTPDGGRIRVIVRRDEDEVVLRVADNGIGLAPELAARAFDLFVQGDRDLDRAQGGLGIGLTLVRRLAELHGGTASVASEGEGKGSEFTVRLPAIGRPADQPHDVVRPRTSGRSILLVEDNEDARETLKALLEAMGHRVETADDGEQGLQRALAGDYDIGLLDIGLPRLDGYEIARRYRKERPGGMRLVAVTGYGLPEDRQRSREAGFDAHLVKPVDPVALEQALARPAARA